MTQSQVQPLQRRGNLAAIGWSLSRDRVTLAALVILALLLLTALLGPWLLGGAATKMNLGARNMPPFSLEQGWLYVLGADSLGRSMVARLAVGAQASLFIALSAVGASLVLGTAIGIIAGYSGRWVDTILMRLTDVIMSFPALLLALIVMFMLGPSVSNVILVLALTRMPLYIRTARAEVLEVRERTFVRAAELMGARRIEIVLRHMLPVITPTLVTIASIDFANVVLIESALSFLGLGIQPPDFSWGAMVATGRGYLATAWWLSFWPGLMILVTTISLNLAGNWLRTFNDPRKRSAMD